MMCETTGARMNRSLLLLALSLQVSAVVGCAAPEDAAAISDEANLDTSGCSGVESAASSGPVQVSASRPPRASCWNVDTSGLVVTYGWTQTNDAHPSKSNLGFWVGLNGQGTFVKADDYACTALAGGGYGHDTSGTTTYGCTARKHVDFAHAPALRSAAYGADGKRVAWNVEVAVALDDDGHWDSRDGQNYRFAF